MLAHLLWHFCWLEGYAIAARCACELVARADVAFCVPYRTQVQPYRPSCSCHNILPTASTTQRQQQRQAIPGKTATETWTAVSQLGATNANGPVVVGSRASQGSPSR